MFDPLKLERKEIFSPSDSFWLLSLVSERWSLPGLDTHWIRNRFSCLGQFLCSKPGIICFSINVFICFAIHLCVQTFDYIFAPTSAYKYADSEMNWKLILCSHKETKLRIQCVLHHPVILICQNYRWKRNRNGDKVLRKHLCRWEELIYQCWFWGKIPAHKVSFH